MKSGKHRRDRSGRENRSPTAANRAVPKANQPSARKWLFRLAALVLVPLVFLGALEIVLRFAGYGYPTSFFVKTWIKGRTAFIENDKFGLRFFPPELARSPAPVILPSKKSANAYRIFVLGESAALGDPKPAYGFGRHLEVLLNERFPGERFEVVCTAVTAINSHAILPIARECARHQGDLWIVYTGNNEIEGPFGAGTVFGPKAPSLSLIRTGLALKATKIGQLFDALHQRLRGGTYSPRLWRGLKMFVENPVRHDDPARKRVYDHFRRNLEDIVRVGREAGVKIILSTVACNLKDCAPFASVHAANLNDAQKAEWEKFYHEGANSEAAGEFLKALQLYTQAANMDPEFAELQFRLGRCQLALTNYDEARNSFAKARDFDALPFRTDSPLNEIIKSVAARHAGQGTYLLDAADALAQISPQKIPGDEWFYEHVHLNFDGNYQLALLAAEQMAKLLPDSASRQIKSDWPSPDVCARRLGLADWNRYQTYEAMLVRLSDAPFKNQLNHVVRLQRYFEKLVKLKRHMTPEAQRQAREIYQTAISRSPDDHFLHENFAEFLEITGDVKEAIIHWKSAQELLPHHPIAYFHVGRLLDRQGEYTEAQRWLSQALKIRPDFAEVLFEWSQLLLKQGKPAEAAAKCMEALRIQPENARAHFHLANALAAQNKRVEATESLNTAVHLQPGFWEARYLLGVELAARERIHDAQAQFTEVIRLRPDYALGHLNLGVALAKQGRMSEALVEFQETLRLDPDNKPAQQHIETIRSLINRDR